MELVFMGGDALKSQVLFLLILALTVIVLRSAQRWGPLSWLTIHHKSLANRDEGAAPDGAQRTFFGFPKGQKSARRTLQKIRSRNGLPAEAIAE
jgi:hypothetical protein